MRHVPACRIIRYVFRYVAVAEPTTGQSLSRAFGSKQTRSFPVKYPDQFLGTTKGPASTS
jgi:hypothetical protein